MTYSTLLLSDSDIRSPNFHNFHFYQYYYSRKILKRDLAEFAGRKKKMLDLDISQGCQVGVFMPTFSNLAYCKLVGSKKNHLLAFQLKVSTRFLLPANSKHAKYEKVSIKCQPGNPASSTIFI